MNPPLHPPPKHHQPHPRRHHRHHHSRQPHPRIPHPPIPPPKPTRHPIPQLPPGRNSQHGPDNGRHKTHPDLPRLETVGGREGHFHVGGHGYEEPDCAGFY